MVYIEKDFGHGYEFCVDTLGLWLSFSEAFPL